MAAGYEATQDETDDGVKVFEIHDDTCRHPVAVVARRLTKEVADAQGRVTAPAVDVVQQVIEEAEAGILACSACFLRSLGCAERRCACSAGPT
jgi:flagellar basal body rod protein FlgC